MTQKTKLGKISKKKRNIVRKSYWLLDINNKKRKRIKKENGWSVDSKWKIFGDY